MRAIDDPVQLAAGAAIFRRALARRPDTAASAPAATPPAAGAVPPAPDTGHTLSGAGTP